MGKSKSEGLNGHQIRENPYDNQSEKEQTDTKYENDKDKVSEFDNEGNAEGKEEQDIKRQKKSRSTDNEKGKHLATSSAGAIEGVNGVSNNKLESCAVPNQIIEENTNMAMFQLPDLVHIDPKPFDPATYEVGAFYVADAAGSMKQVPDDHIIRWRKTTEPEGTISVESNARFVAWSDGSLQLFIGDEVFGMAEQEDAKETYTEVFLEVSEGEYCFHGISSRTLWIPKSALPSKPRQPLSAASNCEMVIQPLQARNDVSSSEGLPEKMEQGVGCSQGVKILPPVPSEPHQAFDNATREMIKQILQDLADMSSDGLLQKSEQDTSEPETCSRVGDAEVEQEEKAAVVKKMADVTSAVEEVGDNFS